MLTLGCTCKFIPPPWYKGGGWKPPPRVFDMLQYFETMKAVNGGISGGTVTSSTMVTILGAILDFTKNWKSG